VQPADVAGSDETRFGIIASGTKNSAASGNRRGAFFG
jgi:hypothetical protein